MSAKARAWLVLALTVSFVAAPLLSHGFGGFRPDQFPVPQDHPPIEPAGWAFSIWLVIYAWLMVSAIYGVLKRPEDKSWRLARPALATCLALGTVWIPIAGWSPILATISLWLMTGAALTALALSPRKDYALLRAPVALLAGWLCMAAAVSLGFVLAGYGLTSEETAAIIALVIALVGMLRIQRRHPDAIPFVLAGIWALTAIIVPTLPVYNLPITIIGMAGGGLLVYRILQLNLKI